MNIKLSVATVRTEGKNGFVIEKEGKTLVTFVDRLASSNIKEDVLITLEKGLRALRPFATHEDVVIIEIQNQHLQKWLSGLVEYKEYSKYLDKVFETLDSIDCRYRFIYVANPYAKGIVKKAKINKKIEGTGVSGLLEELQ